MAQLGVPGRALVRHLAARGAAVTPEILARIGELPGIAAACKADPAFSLEPEVLMAAVEGGHLPIVEWLLAQGASANARTASRSQQTVLHAAAWNGQVEIVRTLVRAGADLLAVDDENGSTPPGWAETALHLAHSPDCAAVVAHSGSDLDYWPIMS